MESGSTVSVVAAAVSAFFAWRAHVHSKRTHHELTEFERKRLELEKQWRREDREDAERQYQERNEREARTAGNERIETFIECMTKERPTGMGSSLDCGLAALESDEEIQKANDAYKARTGKSAFFGYEHYFKDIDAKASLSKWRTMTLEEQNRVGGLDKFLADWPKKPRRSES